MQRLLDVVHGIHEQMRHRHAPYQLDAYPFDRRNSNTVIAENIVRSNACCEKPCQGLNQLNDGTDKRRVPLQDEDHHGNDLHLVLGFPRL